MTRPVHIVAVGARTPVGLNAETAAAAVRAGVSLLGWQPTVLDSYGDPVRGAMDAKLDPSLRGSERLVHLARPPLIEVGTKLAAASEWPQPIEVVLALPEPRPGWTDGDAERVARELGGLTLPRLGRLHVTLGAQGHAGVLAEMDAAARRIASGELELCIVGGVDSYFDTDTIEWLERNSQLALEDVPIGFSPGEGAGFVALASANAVRTLRAAALATLGGSHTARETRLIKTDAINLGKGLAAAVKRATAGLSVGAIDAIYCDINGERYRSEEWGFVALALPHVCRDPSAYELSSAAWGDVGAASGALFTVLAVAGWQRGYARGTRALLWAGSESGLRGAVVVQRAGAGV